MRVVVLILVVATAFYTRVNCEESAATVTKSLELKDTGVKGGDRHEDEDKDKDIKQLTKKLDLLRSSLLAHHCQFAESQQQTKTLHLLAQLQSEKESVAQLQQQVSKLQDESVQNRNKHQTQDKDYANLLTEIKLLQSNLTTQEQQLEASQQQSAILKSQLQIENSTLVQLQGNVSDLNKASAISDQKHQAQDKDYANMLLEIEQLKSNLSSNQQQLNDTKDQLQSKTTIIEQLQRQVLDLTAANVMAGQTIQELQMNVAIQQSQLTALQQKPAVQWVKWAPYDPIPENAVFVGYSWDNIPSYVGRTDYDGTNIAVKVCPTIPKATFSFKGQELTATSVEILTGSGFSWGWGANGDVPSNALPFGKHYGGSELLYIGRAHHFSTTGSSLISGSIIPKIFDGHLYIPLDGTEYRYDSYQVLCHD